MPGSLVGRTLGGSYRLERAIGEGGMGAVYEATDLKLGRRVAVKVLLLDAEDKMVARFEQEALATARLASPNIVAVTDFRRAPGEPPFLVMELLMGESLRDRMKRAPRMPVRDAVRIATQLLGALAVAHAAGIVHRDIKPPNVFLVKTAGSDEEIVKLLDFGIAKVKGDFAKVQTTQGTVMGTPVYFAPEQLLGGEIDGRTDVHAASAVLFEMLAGRRPFDAENPVDLAAAILHAAPPSLTDIRPDVPVGLAAAIADGLAKERTLRPTAEELAARIAPFAAAPTSAPIIRIEPVRAEPVRTKAVAASPPAPPPRRSRAPWIALGLVTVGAAGAVVYVTAQDAPVVAGPRAPVDASVDVAVDAPLEASADATVDAMLEASAPKKSAEDYAREARYHQARLAGMHGDFQKARDLLYATVMDGGADPEEARVLREACKRLRDRECVAAVREMYPPPDAGEPDGEADAGLEVE